MDKKLSDAIALVESAGYTVSDDRRLNEYYREQSGRLSELVDDAMVGDWVGAEDLLRLMKAAPGHIPYSQPLTKFNAFLFEALLSRRDITAQGKAGKRSLNPLLAAVLGADCRKDYLKERQQKYYQVLFDAHVENDTLSALKLEHDVSPKSGLCEHLAFFETEAAKSERAATGENIRHQGISAEQLGKLVNSNNTKKVKSKNIK